MRSWEVSTIDTNRPTRVHANNAVRQMCLTAAAPTDPPPREATEPAWCGGFFFARTNPPASAGFLVWRTTR